VPLYPEMTVREYLEFVAAAKGVHHVDRKAAVDKAIERCNLEEVEDQLVATISRGFKQRTGLAQAVLNEPPVLILDEPTVGLDPAQIREIRELIRELGRKSTIVLSTHILPEVEMTCNRVIIINRGRIRAMDTPQNLAATMREKTILGLQVQGPPDQVREALRRVEGVKAVDLRETRNQVATFRVETDPRRDLRPELARLIVSRDWSLLELKTEHLSLEEVFLEVVQHEDELDLQERQESPQAVEAVSGGEKP
ncbi:MAG TPA: ATP-binding cassette domain-containing protein, partial [Candidatus Nitrosotenuis sp.]|nr:ATP-binding cassette domain-containing protein [Candidatus Nitrosotenuis sp.]